MDIQQLFLYLFFTLLLYRKLISTYLQIRCILFIKIIFNPLLKLRNIKYVYEFCDEIYPCTCVVLLLL